MKEDGRWKMEEGWKKMDVLPKNFSSRFRV
jgi:hypothetical protein